MHPFSTPQKHQKTVRFSDIFRGVVKGYILNECVKTHLEKIILLTIEVVTSWEASARRVEYIFNYIFWILNHFKMKIGHLIDRVMGNVFLKNFAQFGGLHPKPMSFFVYQSNVINQKLTLKNLFFHSFESAQWDY